MKSEMFDLQLNDMLFLSQTSEKCHSAYHLCNKTLLTSKKHTCL